MKVVLLIENNGIVAEEPTTLKSYTEEAALKEGMRIVKRFNREEKRRYGDRVSLRKFVGLGEILDRNETHHKWSKQNLFCDSHGRDTWKCLNCNRIEKTMLPPTRITGCIPKWGGKFKDKKKWIESKRK